VQRRQLSDKLLVGLEIGSRPASAIRRRRGLRRPRCIVLVSARDVSTVVLHGLCSVVSGIVQGGDNLAADDNTVCDGRYRSEVFPGRHAKANRQRRVTAIFLDPGEEVREVGVQCP